MAAGLLRPCLSFLLLSGIFTSVVMSIDLGNEFMKIGLVKPGVPMEIVLNVESSRKSTTVVALRKGDDREFANAAMNTATRFPSSAYIFLRELLAKNTSNPIVKQFQERFPYYKLEDDPERATMNFEHPDGTKYSVEELLAMIMESAKVYATKFAEQKVTDAVILCPVHFNQAERRALKRSAEMAGIKVLQLMNNHAAVALNYGVFRRKEFNSTAQNYMFFDMGSTSTTVSIVSYQVVKMKVGSIVETNPQVTVRGVGFNRNLGSLEITLRIRNHLARLFNDLKKTEKDVLESPRAMAKLHKEAERVKKILSANSETYAQVENLIDDQDFKAKVVRAEVEAMCADVFEKIAEPVEQALKSSEMTMGEITEVILMGGGTRVPKVQEMLQKVVKREELGKSINTDEAAALGAVYQAAYLSTGFRVKTFSVKDANVYPIQVEFERSKLSDDGAEMTTKTIKRTLFSRLNPYPQKKVMTFNKHNDDFSFNVNYGDMEFLSQSELDIFGTRNLSVVGLEGVKEQIDKHVDNFTESKGVKAHFRLDESGLLQLDEVEVVFEQQANPAADESAFSKLSSTISSFFGSSTSAEEDKSEGSDTEAKSESSEDKDKPEDSEEATGDGETPTTTTTESPKSEAKDSKKSGKDAEKPNEDKPKREDKTSKKSSESEKTGEKVGNKTEDKTAATDSSGNTTSTNTTTPADLKPKTIKRKVSTVVKTLDSAEPDSEHIKASKELLMDLTKKDEEKNKLSAVKNELEAFSYDVKNKLYEEEYEMCSTEEEREEIREKLTVIMDWYDEQPLVTPLKEYEDKLVEAKKLVRALYKRVAEFKERPRALEALKSTLNHTQYMVKSMRNYSLVAPDGEGPFTDVELTTLETLHKETKEWMKKMKAEQKLKLATDTPAFTIDDVAGKISALDREVKYLLNKAKTWVPKKPKVTILDSNTTKSSNKTTTEIPATGNNTADTEIPASGNDTADASTPSSDSSSNTDGESADGTDLPENTISSPDVDSGEENIKEDPPETQEPSPPVENIASSSSSSNGEPAKKIDSNIEKGTLEPGSDASRLEDDRIEL